MMQYGTIVFKKWASHKSFQSKGNDTSDTGECGGGGTGVKVADKGVQSQGRNQDVDFVGQKRHHIR